MCGAVADQRSQGCPRQQQGIPFGHLCGGDHVFMCLHTRSTVDREFFVYSIFRVLNFHVLCPSGEN